MAFIVALVATPAIRTIARRAGRISQPTSDRWHETPVALLGGIAIFLGVVVGIAPVLAGTFPQIGGQKPQIANYAIGIIASSLVMFGAGLADDLWGLRPNTKLILQAVAGAILVSSGCVFLLAPSTVVNVLVTVFWFIALTNAMNLLDNMDGITAGVAAIAAIGFAVLFSDQPALAGLALAVAGATIGFLIFNFSRASIFMGDAGSMFLGAMLAGLGAAYSSFQTDNHLDSVLLPILLVLVPVLDTMLVMTTRFLARRPVMQGGKDHTTHRLARIGLADWQVAIALYAVGGIASVLAVTLARTSNPATAWAGILFVLTALIIMAYLAKLPIYPRSTGMPVSRIALLVDDLLHTRRILDVLVDLAVFAVAYWGAFLLKWDGNPPIEQSAALSRTLALVVGLRVAAFFAVGAYRGRWHQVSVPDVHRILEGTALGTIAIWILVGGLVGPVVPVSVFLLDGVLVLMLAFGVRLSFRSFDAVRLHIGPRGAPTLIYGAGSGGELAVRELYANGQLGLFPVGFIDDDPHKRGATILGVPVLGGVNALSQMLATHKVERVVIGTKALGPEITRSLSDSCMAAGIPLLQMRVDLSPVKREWTAEELLAKGAEIDEAFEKIARSDGAAASEGSDRDARKPKPIIRLA